MRIRDNQPDRTACHELVTPARKRSGESRSAKRRDELAAGNRSDVRHYATFALLRRDPGAFKLMPEMTGTELARRLQQSHPTLPVILATGFAHLDASEAADLTLPRLSKPYGADALMHAIDKAPRPRLHSDTDALATEKASNQK